jgi:ABC-type multidrug transport system fused ATPase/permease subunit
MRHELRGSEVPGFRGSGLEEALAIVFDDVHLAFDEKVILDGVSFTLPRGRMCSGPTRAPSSSTATASIG